MLYCAVYVQGLQQKRQRVKPYEQVVVAHRRMLRAGCHKQQQRACQALCFHKQYVVTPEYPVAAHLAQHYNHSEEQQQQSAVEGGEVVGRFCFLHGLQQLVLLAHQRVATCLASYLRIGKIVHQIDRKKLQYLACGRGIDVGAKQQVYAEFAPRLHSGVCGKGLSYCCCLQGCVIFNIPCTYVLGEYVAYFGCAVVVEIVVPVNTVLHSAVGYKCPQQLLLLKRIEWNNLFGYTRPAQPVLFYETAIIHGTCHIIGFPKNEAPHEIGGVKTEVAISEHDIALVVGVSQGCVAEQFIYLLAGGAGEQTHPCLVGTDRLQRGGYECNCYKQLFYGVCKCSCHCSLFYAREDSKNKGDFGNLMQKGYIQESRA